MINQDKPTISMVNQSKVTSSMTGNDKVFNHTWDDSRISWDDALITWDSGNQNIININKP